MATSDELRRKLENTRSNMESLARDGAAFRASLVAVLHDETGIGDLDQPKMLAWIRAASGANRLALRATSRG